MTVIAYLVSDYHAPSHTFVRREIEALRALGETVLPFAIRGEMPADGEAVPTILQRPAWHHARAVLRALAAHPRRFLATWVQSLKHRPPGVRGLAWSQFHLVEALTLAGLLKRSGATRLHSHFANSGATVGMLAAKLANIPWSLTLHGISETDYPAGYLLADKLRAASFVAIASRFMQAQAMRLTEPAIWRRFAIVHCGIDPAKMSDHAPRKVDDDAIMRIACVGRLSAEKGYHILFDALGILAASGAVVHVDIVGDGPARQMIEDRVLQLPPGCTVRLRGSLAESKTLKIIATADMFVLPSLMEGLPVVLMESMAIGVPVIASRVAGIPELVEHDITGLTFTPTDAAALAVAIRRLHSDASLRQRLVHAAKARVLTEFTIQASAVQLKELFASTVAA